MIHIDISVFVASPPASHGVLHGPVDMQTQFAKGAQLSLLHPHHALPAPLSHCWLGMMTVDVALPPSAASGWQLMLGLEDMYLPDGATAQQFVAYLQSAFGLHFDPTHEGD